MNKNIKLNDFLMKILNGTALAIVVGLMPNAILGGIFSHLSGHNEFFESISYMLLMAQAATPVLVGLAIGYQFKLQAMETAIIGAVCIIGSGQLIPSEQGLIARGIGDLINTMLAGGLAVYLLSLIRGKLGSLTIILSVLLGVMIPGIISIFTLPYVKQITTGLGTIIQNFTNLQPLIMSILLCVSFSLIVISPISAVAIAYAIGIDGLASGAANLGVVSTTAVLMISSIYVNKIGIPISLFLGSTKMYMPHWLKNPIINIPLVINAIINGISAYIFNIHGTTASAGFGYTGLAGPINAWSFMQGSPISKTIPLLLAYLVIPFATAYIIEILCTKTLKLYSRDIFIFNQE